MPLYPIIIKVPSDIQAAKGRPKVQALSRLAREATQQSARLSLGHDLPDFPKDADGVPQPVSGTHWSLSHKSALVAGVVAPHPVGIDVEFHRPVKAGMHARIATPGEWRLGQPEAPLDSPPAEALFYRFWTAKEAVLKAVGQGLVGLSGCRVVALPSPRRMDLTHVGAPWEVVQRWYGRHLVAVAYESRRREACGVQWPPDVPSNVNTP